MAWRRLLFGFGFLSAVRFTVRIAFFCKIISYRKRLQKWYGSSTRSGPWTAHDRMGCFEQMQTPISDRVETKGLVYFARMLDKIRLHAARKLPPDYFVGVDDDPTMFDARCTRFLGIEYKELAVRTLQGGSDDEILEWCLKRGRRPNEEEIKIWNAFLLKRGWRDEASADLQAAKERNGWGNRDDIQTWVDLHDAEEGRLPRRSIVNSES